jgi:hypothetical protein
MVCFNFARDRLYTEKRWTLTMQGDADDYLHTIGAILHLLPVESDFYNRDDCHAICTLIDAMLPDAEQLMTLHK